LEDRQAKAITTVLSILGTEFTFAKHTVQTACKRPVSCIFKVLSNAKLTQQIIEALDLWLPFCAYTRLGFWVSLIGPYSIRLVIIIPTVIWP